MSLNAWLTLNKRVTRLERQLQKLEQDNITLISTPFLEPSLEEVEGEVTRGREVEEDASLLDEETVEEREYREEQKWLSQRKQKEKMV